MIVMHTATQTLVMAVSLSFCSTHDTVAIGRSTGWHSHNRFRRRFFALLRRYSHLTGMSDVICVALQTGGMKQGRD
jgi:hypothetical protein